MKAGDVVWWVIDSRTGNSFGRPRPTEAAATKRAESANLAIGIPGTYIVRAARIVQADGADAGTDAKEATRAAHRASKARQAADGGYVATAAEALEIAGLHELAMQAWADIAVDSGDLFAQFLADAHSTEQDGWLEFVKGAE